MLISKETFFHSHFLSEIASNIDEWDSSIQVKEASLPHGKSVTKTDLSVTESEAERGKDTIRQKFKGGCGLT